MPAGEPLVEPEMSRLDADAVARLDQGRRGVSAEHRAAPAAGSANPSSMLIAVDLPAPFGPR